MAYQSVTLSTLRARLQDRYTGDPFWTNQDADDALNESLRQFNMYTGYWRGTTTAATVALTPFISVPATMTYRTRVYVAGKPLTRKSIVEWYRMRRNWRTQTTLTGGAVPTAVTEWAPVGLRQIAIWPQDAGGTVLSIDAVKITPILTLAGDFVDIGDEELNLILGEALWVLSFKRPSLQPGFEDLHDTFLQGCLERNDQLRASAFYREVLGLDQQQRLHGVRRQNRANEPAAGPAAGVVDGSQ